MSSKTGLPGTFAHRGHPIMRIILMAPTNYDGPALPTSVFTLTHTAAAIFGWRKVSGSLNYGALEDDRGVGKFRLWLEKTPAVFGWAKSDRFLWAPREFPREVAQVFAPYTMSPFELSFLLHSQHQDFGRCLLYAYCAGLLVEELAAIVGRPMDFVLTQMAWAARSLLEDPRFVAWLWNVDWSGLPIPPDVDESLLTRMVIKNTLMSSELLLVEGAQLTQIRKIVASERLNRLAVHAPKLARRPIPAKLLMEGVIRGS